MSAEAIAIPDVGEIIGEGRFELGRKLGEGGMSTVFVARDRFLDRDVALKLLIPRYVGRPEREQRFLNEAEYLRRVQHHVHIAQVIDFGRLRDRNRWPWLSTEIMSGQTLDWLVIRRSLDIHKILEIAHELAEALRACHEAGVVHRDLTPANVFVLDDGSIKLFDFSHAADLHGPKLAVGARERLTGIYETPGTVGYIAPEQAANAAPDASMDSFGFGVLLYELVSGSNPYSQYSDRDAFIEAQCNGTLEAPRLYVWAYDAPEELAALVHECMQREGSKRPGMSEISARLEAIIGAIGEAEIRIPPLTVAAQAQDVNEDVTTAIDASAIIAARRGRTKADPKVIGAWNVGREAARVVTVREAPAAALTAESAEQTEVVPLAPAPPVEPPPVASEPERELAFARLPQLREAPAVPSVVIEADFAGPPELRQHVKGPLGCFDPGDSEEAEAELAPTGRSRGRVVGLVAGLGLVVMILSWGAYSQFFATEGGREKKNDDDRDQSAASNDDHHVAAESGGASLEGDTGADDSDAVVETGGREIVPEVEPVEVDPQPKNGKPHNGKPKNGKPANGEPDNGNDPTCEGVEADARAAHRDRDWARVAKLSAKKACWTSQNERVRLRVNALSNLARYDECTKAGTGSTDPEVQSIVGLCKAATN